VNSNLKWIKLAKIGLLVSLGLLIPALGLPQQVTGPLVNALLIITVVTSGVGAAMLVGMVTPLNALMSGILPLSLMVIIPFIALANALFVGIFGALRTRNYWLGLGAAAVAKFGLLFTAVTWLVARPITVALAGGPKPVALSAAIVNMMEWPQLATALAGGVLAYGGIALYQRLRK
jgi:hypothetical protein